MRFFRNLLADERGAFNIIPWLIGLTSLINVGHRQSAAATLDEDIETPEQTTGSVIQDFANRGIMIGPNSPAVQEALRRRSLGKRQQKAQVTLSQGDPFSTLFGLFTQD